MKRIEFIEPIAFTRQSIKDIQEYLTVKTGNGVAEGIKAFENALSKYLKVKYCVCVNSGTTGLILAIKALGIEGEVIVPSFTFSGTVHALAWNGITPKFTDIDRRNFNLDLDKIKRNITARTKAILAVHMYGNPSDIESLERLAKEYKLKLIFDSAHGLGSTYRSTRLGGFGDCEVFSLQTTKILPVLEGGFITTNQKALYMKLLMLRSQGNQGDGNCLYIGLNARMHPLAAVLGRSALKGINTIITKRQRLGKLYLSLLSKVPGIKFQEINERAGYNYQYMPVLIDKEIFGLSRDKLMQKLEDKGIITRKYFHPPVHQFSCYGYIKKHLSLKVTEFISNNILCLPFHSSMSISDIEYIVRVICAARSGTR